MVYLGQILHTCYSRFFGGCIDQMMQRALGDVTQGQMMYFLVNSSPSKAPDVATSNFAGAFVI